MNEEEQKAFEAFLKDSGQEELWDILGDAEEVDTTD